MSTNLKKLATKLATLDYTGGRNPLVTSKGKPSKAPQKNKMKVGDWVRVRRGPLEGAEGSVIKVEPPRTSLKITTIEVRQLNGNIIRLPRAHFEFAAFAGEMPDT